MPQVHPTAIIEGNVLLGQDVKVYAYAVLQGNITVGDGCVIGAGVHIFGDVKIGKNVRIQSQGFIPSGTVIEDDVFLGPNVTILNDKFPPSHGVHWRPVTVKQGATIGGAVTLLPGVTIHEHASIGAGSVVTKDIPSYALVYGHGAQIRGMKYPQSDEFDEGGAYLGRRKD